MSSLLDMKWMYESLSDLHFRFITDSFYEGEAVCYTLRQYQVPFNNIVEMLSAKYGLYNFEEYSLDSSGKVIAKFFTWKDLCTKITPPGKIEIHIDANISEGGLVRISYSIGESWALLKTDNDY